MKFRIFRVLILLSAACAPGWAQHTFTASPIPIADYQVASLNWLSDDGKTGYGSGLSRSAFSTQCFSYSDGKTNPFVFPGANCLPLAAAQGNFVFRTSTD